jgi:hypothetical protein
VSEERLSTIAAGDVIYRFKKPWDDGAAALKMTPSAFWRKAGSSIKIDK